MAKKQIIPSPRMKNKWSNPIKGWAIPDKKPSLKLTICFPANGWWASASEVKLEQNIKKAQKFIINFFTGISPFQSNTCSY